MGISSLGHQQAGILACNWLQQWALSSAVSIVEKLYSFHMCVLGGYAAVDDSLRPSLFFSKPEVRQCMEIRQ